MPQWPLPRRRRFHVHLLKRREAVIPRAELGRRWVE